MYKLYMAPNQFFNFHEEPCLLFIKQQIIIRITAVPTMHSTYKNIYLKVVSTVHNSSSGDRVGYLKVTAHIHRTVSEKPWWRCIWYADESHNLVVSKWIWVFLIPCTCNVYNCCWCISLLGIEYRKWLLTNARCSIRFSLLHIQYLLHQVSLIKLVVGPPILIWRNHPTSDPILNIWLP